MQRHKYSITRYHKASQSITECHRVSQGIALCKNEGKDIFLLHVQLWCISTFVLFVCFCSSLFAFDDSH